MSQKGAQIGKTSPQQNLELGPFCWEKTSANWAPELRFLFGSLNYVIEMNQGFSKAPWSHISLNLVVLITQKQTSKFTLIAHQGPTWSLELEAWSLEVGAWSLKLGAWSLELAAWRLELAAWSLKLQNQIILTMIDEWWLVIGDWLMIGYPRGQNHRAMNHRARMFNHWYGHEP